MARRFRGQDENKVDAKGRVSIPASFRRVIEAGDPEWGPRQAPRMYLVFGDERRNYLQGFTIEAMDEIDEKVDRHPVGSAKRKAMERLYYSEALELTVDETGRIILNAMLRNKIGLELNGMAKFVASGKTFEIWHPDAYETSYEILDGEGFDPALDPSVYVDQLD